MKPTCTWPEIERGSSTSRLTSARLTSIELPGETVRSATFDCPCGTKSGGNGNESGKRSSSDQRPLALSSAETWILKSFSSWAGGAAAWASNVAGANSTTPSRRIATRSIRPPRTDRKGSYRSEKRTSRGALYRRAPRTPRAELSTRDRRHDRELVAVGDRGVEARARADVLAVQVEVDEAPERAVRGQELCAQLRRLRGERADHLGDGRAVRRHLGASPHEGPKRRRNPDLDRHERLLSQSRPTRSPSWRNGASGPGTSHAVSSRGSPCSTAITSVSRPGHA